MKKWNLNQKQLNQLKKKNKNCVPHCYKCDFWNECFFNGGD